MLVKKLIWGNRPSNQEAYKVISACSLFEMLGYDREVADQRQFVSNKICRIEDEIFYGIAQDFIRRGILDRRHRFIRVVPRPLAIRLAAEWWSKCPPERAKQLIMEDMPKGMAEALCAQMAMLHFVPEAQAVVSDLCGDQAPFGQAEVLNSEKGSRLFRSFVEVNPQATVRALEKAFGGLRREELLKVGPGRRNLIWALEKLCFWDETFLSAAKLMLAFASAENETWGNNATNQFLQLFHVYLSGTQASPILRIQVIDFALSKEDKELRKLGIKALGHALKTDNFSRTGGVERQGSRAVMQDWMPETWGEVFDYWMQCLERLTPIACEHDEMSILAREQITANIRGLVRSGRVKDIETCLNAVIKERGNFWPEAYKAIQNAIKYEGPIIPEEGRNTLNEWLNLLSPQLISEKLKLLVSIPPWTYDKDESGKYIDLAEQKAIDLANDCANNLPQLYENLDVIFRGEQRKGFIFGYTLANYIDKPEQFVDKALSTLGSISSNESNSIVLGGFLASLKPKFSELVKKTLDTVVGDDILCIHAIDLTRVTEPEIKDLKRLLKLIEQEKINVENLRSFSYGRVLSHLTPEDVISFCKDIREAKPQALAVSFEILYMYSFQEDEKFERCKEELRKIVLTQGILNRNGMRDTDIYNLQEIVNKLLTLEEPDESLAKGIAQEIKITCSNDKVSFEWESSIKVVIGILLKHYLQVTWPILSEGLLSDDWRLKSNMERLLCQRAEIYESNWVSVVQDDFLIEWCKKDTEQHPAVLVEIVPILINSKEGCTFHPVAKYLIDNYGERKEILSSIFRNMGPSSWSGSIIPYYKKQIEALEKILDHPKQTVHEWAQKIIIGLQGEIERERNREEEEEFGVYY